MVGVVILNYKNYKEAINCIDSLLNDNYLDVEIVIVDNGSGNDSVEVFNERYGNNSNICIIPLENNIGYAKGNNVGISYLRGKGIENIFIANSDLIFPNSPLLNQMVDEIGNGDAVIVPTIKNLDGGNDQRVIYKKKMFFLRMFKELIKSILKDISGKVSENNVNYTDSSPATFENCYTISGSGYMLTKYYFSIYNGLFFETFLYGEECGTIILIHKAGLKSKVIVTDPIIHKGGASTPNKIKKMTKQKKKINLDSDIKILKLLLMSRRRVKMKY